LGKDREIKESWLSPKFISAIIVALFFGVALYLRVYFPYDEVFSGDWIKFTTNDAYYHMRLVDNLVRNFPHLITFDPYFIYPSIYPGGEPVGSIHFFDWLLATIIWVIGLGSPTQHTIDVVGVYYPAVLGALTVIPVYFIGKELFGHWAGIISAGLIALLPGEFMGRSILGSTDQHIAETLFTAVAILFLILAIKAASQRHLTFNHFYRRDWTTIAKPVIYSLLAGIFLGIYLLTWIGAALFVFIISAYFIIQFIIDHLKHKSTDYLCLVGVIVFLVTLIVFLPVSQQRLYLASLVIALLIPLVLNGISRLMAGKGIKLAYYPLSMVGFGLAGLGIFYIVNPSLLNLILKQFSIFAPPRGVLLTTLEAQPLLFPTGDFSLSLAWGNFTTGFFLSLISLGFLIYLIVKHGNAEKSLLVVWSLVILAATLGQRRFAYYLAVNVAVLTGYLSWRLLKLAGFKEWITKPVEIPRKVEKKKAKPKKSQKVGFRITTTHISISLCVIFIVFFLAFFPNPKVLSDAKRAGVPLGTAWWNSCLVGTATATAKPHFSPGDAWVSSLSWLKENTPDPFGNPNFYYELYPEGTDYPQSAYGVTAWWDYGYWITRIAHRLPNANPSQDPEATARVARFFSSQDENSANEIAKEMGSSYIIIDYETATTKFHAVATWAGSKPEEFFDIYYLPQEDKLVPVWLFYPEYYRALSTRLYNFDGKAVTPEVSLVISYQERVSEKGEAFKQITWSQPFPSYEEAIAYVSSQKSANYKIVGTNPFISPVPLDTVEHYKLIHSSESGVTVPEVGVLPEVKIFEYFEYIE